MPSDSPPSGPVLRKSTQALALVPRSRSLTPLMRQSYAAMLHIAHTQLLASVARPDQGFTASLTDICDVYGGSRNSKSKLAELLQQMVSLQVEWRVVERVRVGDVLRLGPDDTASLGPPPSTDETRLFTHFSELRVYQRNQETWLHWFYPPTLRDELLNPERWARIDLLALGRLTSYCAIALYEICARYRTSPSKMTSRQDCAWWQRVLQGRSDSKPLRAWRKFKSDTLLEAIEEVNALTDLTIELREFKTGREVTSAQFVVRSRKTGAGGQAGLADKTASVEPVEPIGSTRTGDDKPDPSKAASNLMGTSTPASSGQEQADSSALAALRSRFASLDADSVKAWLHAYRAANSSNISMNTSMVRKLIDQGHWRSPIIERRVLTFFADRVLGPSWQAADLPRLTTADTRPPLAHATPAAAPEQGSRVGR